MKLLTLLSAIALLASCTMVPSNKEDSNKQQEQSSAEPASGKSEQKSEGTSEKASSSDDGGYTHVEHSHSWDTAWTCDSDYHWHKCTSPLNGATCGEINDKAAHTWDAGTVTKEPGAYTTGVKTYTCTVCQYKKTETIPATGGGEDAGAFTFDETALNTAQEIHTANQKKYLNLNKAYNDQICQLISNKFKFPFSFVLADGAWECQGVFW